MNDPVGVKREESTAMDRLEAALDLNRDLSVLATAGTDRLLSSIAGAADFAVLAWDRGNAGQNVPAWAHARGLRWPLGDWLDGLARHRAARYVRVVGIPDSTGESRRPGSQFLVFQDEAATQLETAGMPSSKARRILGAFAEMTDNAIEHSLSPVQPFATFEISGEWWEFSVTDLGRGVPNSLRTNQRYATLNDHAAVRAALQDGVSRFDDQTRGTGYGVMIRALAEHECVVRLRTGRVVVRWSGHGIGLTNLVYDLVSARPGLHLRVAGAL
jgi:hypothetical protein